MKTFDWHVEIHWKSCTTQHFATIPQLLKYASAVSQAILNIDLHEVCCGNTDSKLLELLKTRKGTLKDQSGTDVNFYIFEGKKVVAFEDSYNGLTTVRTSGCLLVIPRDGN